MTVVSVVSVVTRGDKHAGGLVHWPRAPPSGECFTTRLLCLARVSLGNKPQSPMWAQSWLCGGKRVATPGVNTPIEALSKTPGTIALCYTACYCVAANAKGNSSEKAEK